MDGEQEATARLQFKYRSWTSGYVCSEPGDRTGTYVSAKAHDALIAERDYLLREIEGMRRDWSAEARRWNERFDRAEAEAASLRTQVEELTPILAAVLDACEWCHFRDADESPFSVADCPSEDASLHAHIESALARIEADKAAPA